MQLYAGAHGLDAGQVAQHDVAAGVVPRPVGELAEHRGLVCGIRRLGRIQIDPLVAIPALELEVDVAVGVAAPAAVAPAVVRDKALKAVFSVRGVEVHAGIGEVAAVCHVAACGKLIGRAGGEIFHADGHTHPLLVLSEHILKINAVPLAVEAQADRRLAGALFMIAAAVGIRALAADRAHLAVMFAVAGAGNVMQHAVGRLAAAALVAQLTGVVVRRREKRCVFRVRRQARTEIQMQHDAVVRILAEGILAHPEVTGKVRIRAVGIAAKNHRAVGLVAGVDVVMDALPFRAVPAGDIEVRLLVGIGLPAVVHPPVGREEGVAPRRIREVQACLRLGRTAAGHVRGDADIVGVLLLQDSLVDRHANPRLAAAGQILRRDPLSVDIHRHGRRSLGVRRQRTRQHRDQQRQRKDD